MDRLISEKAAYKTLKNYYHIRLPIQEENLKEALSRVTPAQKWIPVDERSPEEPGRYQVTYISRIIPHPLIKGTAMDLYGKKVVGSCRYDENGWNFFEGEIIAWTQPPLLITPYDNGE